MQPAPTPPEGAPAPPVTVDEWGLPVPPPASWTAPQDTELGYTVGEDAEDAW